MLYWSGPNVCALSYNGCRQRNSLLVMHVTEDPDGTYARAVVNYLLSGAWPDVVSSSVSLSARLSPHPLTAPLTCCAANPSAAKKGKGLHWWVFMLIALAILLVTIGVVVALCVTLHYREQSKDEGVLSKKYVKMGTPLLRRLDVDVCVCVCDARACVCGHVYGSVSCRAERVHRGRREEEREAHLQTPLRQLHFHPRLVSYNTLFILPYAGCGCV